MTTTAAASKKRAKATKADATASTPAVAEVQPVAKKSIQLKPSETAMAAPKAKLVRDSFTIPKVEYDSMTSLKRRALALGVEVKKSELIRAGIAVLDGMSDRSFLAALKAVPSLKTGRPKGPTA